MSIKVGINGFGRIGRLIFRVAMERKEVEVVAINDLIKADYCAYLLKYDSTHGTYRKKIEHGEGWMSVDGQKIACYSKRNPEEIPWGKHGVEVVVESTGFFLKKEDAEKHIKAGAKKVLISAPTPDSKMFVMGVNHEEYAGEKIFSNASCTTNCLAPLVYIINENFGIVEGLMSTIHSITSNQRPVDVCIRGDKWRRGRSLMNIIPTSTGAAVAVGKVYPKVNGKLTGMAFRVPLTDVSVVDLTVKLAKPAKKEEINKVLKEASESERFKGIFGYCNEKVVSSDFIHDSRSSIFDEQASIYLNDTFVKLITWYDNEWGYSCRMIDLLIYAARK